MIDISLFLVILIQYSQRNSVIHHCISITKKSDMSITDILLFLVILIQHSQRHTCSVIDISLFLVILIEYSQRHSVINHCDRRITHLGDIDTVVGDIA